MAWPPRRARFALVVSVLLHAGLLVLLVRAPAPPIAPAPAAPLFVEIHEVVRQAAAKAAPATQSPSPPVKASGGKGKRQRAIQKALPSFVEPPADVAKELAPAPGGDFPLAEPPHPDLAHAATRAADSLVSRQVLPTDPAREDRSIQAPFAIEDPNARVAGMLREGLGRDRVDRGMVDPYFRSMGGAMTRAWKPEPKVDAKGLKGFLSEAGRGVRAGVSDYASAWLAAAAAYGKSGSPGDLEGPLDPDGRLKEHIPPGITEQHASHLRSTRIALIRLTQKLDGRLMHVELVQPSIDPEMDREILRELRGGEMVVPVPPHEGLGIHDPIRSLWAFQLTVDIAPPVPMVSGTFDLDALFDRKTREEMGGLIDVRMPLSRRISKQVSLIAVE